MVGRRIWIASSPVPTCDQSSLVFSSFRKRVERSAFSIRVASPITFCRSDGQIDLGGDVGDDVEELELRLARPSHALDELVALQRHRRLRRYRLKERQVLGVKLCRRPLVQSLRDADDLAFDGAHRGAHDGPRLKARLPVDRRIEAGIRIGVVDDEAFAGGEDVPGDAAGVEQADFAANLALRHARIKLAGLIVVEEERGALAVGLARGDLDQLLEHVVEALDPRHLARDRKQHLRAMQLVGRYRARRPTKRRGASSVRLFVLARARALGEALLFPLDEPPFGWRSAALGRASPSMDFLQFGAKRGDRVAKLRELAAGRALHLLKLVLVVRPAEPPIRPGGR